MQHRPGLTGLDIQINQVQARLDTLQFHLDNAALAEKERLTLGAAILGAMDRLENLTQAREDRAVCQTMEPEFEPQIGQL